MDQVREKDSRRGKRPTIQSQLIFFKTTEHSRDLRQNVTYER